MIERRRLVAVVVGLLLATGIVFAAVTYSPVTGEISLQTNSGVTVTTDAHGTQMALTEPFPDDNTVDVVSSNGNVTVSGTGSASVFIDAFGPQLVVSNMSVASNDVTLDPEDKPALTVGGQVDNLTYYDPALDDGQTDLEYAGASGDTTVTFRGLPANTEVSVIDTQHNQQLLAVGTTNSNGNLTVTVPNSEHTAQLQSGDSSNPPVLRNLSPSGEVSSSSVTVSVDVSDDDFGSEGESVNVSLYVDGSEVKNETLTSSGTVSTTVSGLDGGTHNLTATASDSFGNTDREETEFGVPQNLTVLNESDTSQTIANANVTLFFEGNDDVYSRTSDVNGNVSLDGLPLDRPVLVEVRHPDYHTRTYYFSSLAERHTAYLLPSNATTADIIYILDDQTGVFDPPQETALFIKKPVNTTSGTKFVTVVSDQFDATGELPVTLETDTRYRLEVRSPTGEIRAIGNYKVTGDDPDAVLTIGSVRLAGSTEDGTGFGATLQDESGNRVVRYQYTDPDETTSTLNVTIYETGNQSNVLLNETTVATDIGSYTESIIVPSSAPEDIAYTVEYEATFENGETKTGKRFVGDVPEIANDLGLAPNVLSLLGWGTIIGLAGLVAIVDAGAAAVVAVVVATALTWMGAVPIPAPLLGIAGGITALMNYARFQR